VGGGKIFPPPTSHQPFPYSNISVTVPAPTVRPPSRNREPQSFIHSYRRDQLHPPGPTLSPRHHHFAALGQLRHARHVRRPENKTGDGTL